MGGFRGQVAAALRNLTLGAAFGYVGVSVGGISLGYCEGISMSPTLEDGYWIIAESVSINLSRRQVARDAVVFVRKPDDPNTLICKRVVALEGDKLHFELRTPKPYASRLAEYSLNSKFDREALLQLDQSEFDKRLATITVPRGNVWLEGDNLDESNDSRQFGPVPLGLVDSRARFILFPLSRMGLIR